MNTVETNMADAIAKDKSKAILVKASAGTGKSHALVSRLKYRIDNGFVNSNEVIAFTFTKDSAADLVQKIGYTEATIGTIHSISLKLLREYFDLKCYVLDDYGKQSMIFDILRKNKIKLKYMNECLEYISFNKNRRIDYYAYLNSLLHPNIVESVAIEYEKQKTKSHKIDFDDMCLMLLDKMNKNQDISNKIQDSYTEIYLDEAQDVNTIQAKLFVELTKNNKNVFIVGDVKQKIYGFRGSTNWLIDNFSKLYPDSKEYTLPITYRCAKNITYKSNLISKLLDKTTMLTNNDINGKVAIPMIFEHNNDEVEYVCKHAINFFDTTEKTIKILYRTNAQALFFQLNLIHNKIPFFIKEKTNIFNRKEIKLCFDAIKLANESDNMENTSILYAMKDLWKLLDIRESFYELSKFVKSNDVNIVKSSSYIGQFRSGVDTVMKFVDKFKNQSPSIVFSSLAETILDFGAGKEYGDNYYDNMTCVSELFLGCKNLKDCNKIISEISSSELNSSSNERISLSSIHGSKGLEADIVFITGVNDNLFPNVWNDDKVEEMNLFYVALTRARELLYVTGSYGIGNRSFKSHSYIGLIS